MWAFVSGMALLALGRHEDAGLVFEAVIQAEPDSAASWAALGACMSALGEPELKDELLKGKTIGSMTYKVHLDGYDQTELLSGKGKSKRKDFYYFTETTLHGLRYGDWKFLFKTQDKWFNGIQENLNTPLITNLKLDPFERFHEARGFDEWQENRSWTLAPATAQSGIITILSS